jgi:hypothetical protein
MTDETSCEFVSSRGLLKSCMIRAPVPKSSCPTNLQYIQDFIASQTTETATATATPISIYVCGDAFQTFISEYASKILSPFIIVSGDGDKTMFRETIPNKPNLFVLFMLNPLLKGLYCQNIDIEDCRIFLKDKITKLWKANATIFKTECSSSTLDDTLHCVTLKLRQIPIGMDYHTISVNPKHRWLTKGVTTTTPISQECTLSKEIRSKMTPFYGRKLQIYSNVMLCLDRFNDRVSAVSSIPKALLYQQIKFIPRLDTWKNMTQFAFVLSPFGNGLDCHRTWEALLCGCIPIVRTNVFKELFEGLPVLIVANWEDITPTLLKQTMYEFKLKHQQKEFNYEKLTLAYYSNWWKNN